jgi:hypothetical protein
MTAIKKTTSKSSKSPAPAASVAPALAVKTVPVAKVAKPAAVKRSPAKPAVVKRSLAKPVAAKKKPAVPVAPEAVSPAPAPAAPAPKPSAVKPVASKPVVTTISAKIDIGFGNALYIRGESAGLSWDKGLLMTCVTGDQWQIVLGESARPIVFKFLVNDLSWSAGEDYSAVPGSTLALEPAF